MGTNMLSILPDKDRFDDDYSFGIRYGYRLSWLWNISLDLLSYPPNMSLRVSTIGFPVSLIGVAVVVVLVISV
jgi:hypothetical protein